MYLPLDILQIGPRAWSSRAFCHLTAFVFFAACSQGTGASNKDAADDPSSDSSSDRVTDTLTGTDNATDDEDTDEDALVLSPDVGEVIDIPQQQWAGSAATVAPKTGDERYVVQLTSVSTIRGAKYFFDFEARRAGSFAADTPKPLPPPKKATEEETFFRPGHGVRHTFWELAARSLAAGASIASPRPSMQPPRVGDRTSFQMTSGASGLSVTTVEAEVLRVTDRLVVYGDTTNGIGALQGAVIDEVLGNYESVVLPRINAYFGEVSDVDADGKISVLFSPLVGEIGAAAYIYTCDLLDPEENGTMCPYSNEREMIYVAPPSSLGSHMGSPKALTELLSHETQHLVYFHRKYMLGHALSALRTLYLNEGLSGLAQDLCGFQAGILFETAVAIPNVEDFSLTDVLTLGQYDPAGRHNYAIGYLLMRYAFEQMGGDTLTQAGQAVDNGGIAFLDTIESSRYVGLEAIEHATGMETPDFFENFYTAMLLDDRAQDGSNPGVDPRFGFFDMLDDPITGNTRGVTMRLELAGGMVTSKGVPLETATDGIIRAGGVEYILIEAKKSLVPIELHLEVDDPEAKVRMRLVRIR